MSEMSDAEREKQLRAGFPAATNYELALLRLLDTERARADAAEAKVLPDPKAGCACIHHKDGYHYYGIAEPGAALEYDPSCPEHSEHVYDPRSGTWIFADPEKNKQWTEAASVAF